VYPKGSLVHALIISHIVLLFINYASVCWDLLSGKEHRVGVIKVVIFTDLCEPFVYRNTKGSLIQLYVSRLYLLQAINDQSQ